MTRQRRFFNRPCLWGILCGLTLAVAQLFTPAGMGTAQAATTTCTSNGLTQSCTVTFDYSGAAETWTVPPGVTQATFDLYGAQGGDNGNILGGRGGRVTATLNVTPDTNYQILVGGAGFNGGGSGNSGGGGGASDLRTGAVALADRLLVAGGGGGGGGPFQGAGGAGGYPNGGAGGTGGFSGGGDGGTQTGGGAGGYDDGGDPGDAGTLGQGGNSGSGTPYGGGGGGGYYGGGGGGVTFLDFVDGGGGGGGSSYGPVDATFENGVRTGDGLVIITYSQSDTSAPAANPTQSPQPSPSGWNNSNVDVTWNWTDPSTSSGYASGIDIANCTTSLTSSGEGTLTLSATCQDLAGNSSTVTYQANVDKTTPVVTVDNVSDGVTYTLGSVPISGCSTDDALSGVAIPAAFNRSGGNPDGTGSFTITCSGAVDNAGNSAAPVSVGYTVTAGGTLVGVCGGYEVRQTGSNYSAAGWSGAIKVGTSGKNTLNGGSGPDLILGLGGNDKLDGKGGDDILCGGDGVDLLLGMAGNDYLDGGAGNDVLNGGSGDYDQLLAGEGNDTLLDGDGVSNAQGGAGNDLFTLALRKGWRDTNGQTQFVGRLAAGYGNDTVILVILDRNAFFVDVTGDERDDPASPAEGNDDRLGLLGNLSPAPVRLKFEKQLVISAEAEGIVDEEAGAEYLTEPVGEEAGTADLNNRLFLPLVNR